MSISDPSSSLDPELAAARVVLSSKSPHLSTILDGAVASFADCSNPLRLNLTATAIRELMREFLAGVAPDTEIVEAAWFIPDPTSKTGVTRRHRVHFAIYRYLEEKIFSASLVSSVTEIADDLGRATDELSKLTHISAATLDSGIEEGAALFKDSLRLFARLVAAIEEGAEHIKSELEDALRESLSHLFVSAFFDELDELSTHTRPQEADGIEVEVTDVKADGIYFSGTGTVYCDLQFGSDGDCRRGDGAEWEDSFPFSFVGGAALEAPFKPEVNARDVVIDTSSYYE